MLLFSSADFVSSFEYSSFAKLRQYPTICGGRVSSSAHDECYSYSENGQWDLVASLSERKGNMAWVQLSQDEMMISGNVLLYITK